MISLQPCKTNCVHSTTSLLNPSKFRNHRETQKTSLVVASAPRRQVKCSVEEHGREKKSPPERRTFLTLEEAGLVEISGLSTHERFLCRLTISSLNLLRVISEQEGCPIEELNAGKVCDWFLKDKLKREHNKDSAVLQWDDSDFQF